MYGPKNSLPFDPFHLSCERVPITGQKMAAKCQLQDRRWRRAQEFRDSVISVSLAGLGATSCVLTASVLHLG